MNSEEHKKMKARHKGKDVKTQYDLKRDRERMAGERPLQEGGQAAAAPAAPAPRVSARRPRRMAAE